MPKCCDCQKEQPILTSIYRGKPGMLFGEALCDECVKKAPQKRGK